MSRLIDSRSYESGLSTTEWNPTSYSDEYFNHFDYDANGNISYQLREDASKNVIDELFYRYNVDANGRKTQNRLYHLNDASNSSAPNELRDQDLSGQPNTLDDAFYDPGQDNNNIANYRYDEEGRLVRDIQEGIDKIIWRVDGKVKKIERLSTSSAKNVSFDYDAMGNRIAKHVMNLQNEIEKSTYYVLDAQGNTISVYEKVVDKVAHVITYEQSERHIYGSSRLGLSNVAVGLLGNQNKVYKQSTWTHTIGQKTYEITNHLGNVLSVISDKPIPDILSNGNVVSYYLADIRHSSDYSPFGVTLVGRDLGLAGAEDYRYGFNGMEADDEVKGSGNSYNLGLRFFDPRVARMLSIDPKTPDYPWQSPYVYHRNSPIHWIDFIGGGDPPEKIKGVYFVEIKNFTVDIINSNCMGQFTSTCQGQYTSSYSDNYFVNLQQYKATSIWSYVDVVLPGAGCNDGWVTIGQNVENGEISGEKTDNKRAFMAQDKQGTWKVGLGNPPKDSKVGFGGGIPMVINGQKYGEKTVGEYLSAKGYANQNDKSVGKVIVGYNSKTNAMMLVVSPDELENGGMTLDEIRDKLVSLGYDNVMAFDGGSSSTLIQERKELVSPSTIKDNTIPTGLKISGNEED